MPSFGLLVFKLQLRKMAGQGEYVEFVIYGNFILVSKFKVIILYRYDLHCALKSILRDQYALQGSHEFERFFPKTFASVKSCSKSMENNFCLPM